MHALYRQTHISINQRLPKHLPKKLNQPHDNFPLIFENDLKLGERVVFPNVLKWVKLG